VAQCEQCAKAMINRNLIRIRVVQIIYSWYQNRNKNLREAEKELMFGLQKVIRSLLLHAALDGGTNSGTRVPDRNKKEQVLTDGRGFES